MQVKKFEAESVLDALQMVKADLGPEAIIVSTQEMKKTIGGRKRFLVVAAVSENSFRKKELAEKQLGNLFENKVKQQSAVRQKQFIESVYKNMEKKHEAKNRRITSTPYIDISDSETEKPKVKVESVSVSSPSSTGSSLKRVQMAAKEAFRSSLHSDFFGKEETIEKSTLKVELEKKATSRGGEIQTIPPQKQEEPEALKQMLIRLKNCGVTSELVNELKNQSLKDLGRNAERKALVDSWFAKWILNEIKVNRPAMKDGMEIFVGPHGSGKTSALLKLVTHYVTSEQKNVAIVTTDLKKVGALEQLRVYSRILNVPVYVIPDSNALKQQLNNLKAYHKVFVDTPGISLSSMEELDFIRQLAQVDMNTGKNIHLVISALTKSDDLMGVIKRFRVAQFDDLIISNIDQTTQHGILLNMQNQIGVPFHSFGVGSDIIDGFEFASRERVLDLIFKLTKKIGDNSYDNRVE